MSRGSHGARGFYGRSATSSRALRAGGGGLDRKSTRLNSSHLGISYAVFCLKKKKHNESDNTMHPATLKHIYHDSPVNTTISPPHSNLDRLTRQPQNRLDRHNEQPSQRTQGY